MSTDRISMALRGSGGTPMLDDGTAPDLGKGSGDGRVSEQEAGYMELAGAQKDADCETVSVQGGVSTQLGCCNLFNPQGNAQVFSCGTCTHVQQGA